MSTATLKPLLQQILQVVPRIELLKVDVQGMEAPCLLGAEQTLKHVDNIFLEIQDLPATHPAVMYTSSSRPPLDIGEMDALLANYDFVRQYCEDNTELFREMNW